MSTRYFVIARTDCDACGGKIDARLHEPICCTSDKTWCDVCKGKGYTEKLVSLRDLPVDALYNVPLYPKATLDFVSATWPPFSVEEEDDGMAGKNL